MANLDIKDIFEKERFPNSNWQFISLVFYFPVGLILAIIRLFIGIQACLASYILTHTPAIRSIVLRILCLVLGINVVEDKKTEYDKTARILVSNCQTKLDFIAMHLATKCIIPTKEKNLLFNIVPGVINFNENSLYYTNIKTFLEKGDKPLFFQPEKVPSGKNCLLKFSDTAARLTKKIQPVAIRVERPLWANTAPTVLGSSTLLDLFWFLFTPYTVFKIKYLNSITRESEETTEEFIEKIRASIAETLSYRLSNFNYEDKVEYEKRYLDDLNRQMSHPLLGSTNLGSSDGRSQSAELIIMANQVSEVLPHVPRDAIVKDLRRTLSVDITISNILEGNVEFTPVEPSTSTPNRSQISIPSTSIKSDKIIFSKSSKDRMLSFAERKAKMIEEARIKYIERKGIKLDQLR